MNQGFRFCFLAAIVAGACGGEPVGRICDLGENVGDDVDEDLNIVASPSLDCLTRTCLKVRQEVSDLPPNSRYPEGPRGLCTAVCDSDEDCERVPESPCQLGFTCAIATAVGDFCCTKVCVCKDYIVIPEDGKVPEPLECDAANPDNVCCNLEGRPGVYDNCPG